jgi:hypothetical protein
MGLMDTLNQCITAGHEMTKAIVLMTTVWKQGKSHAAGE